MGKRGNWSSTRTKVNRNDVFIAAILTKTEDRTLKKDKCLSQNNRSACSWVKCNGCCYRWTHLAFLYFALKAAVRNSHWNEKFCSWTVLIPSEMFCGKQNSKRCLSFLVERNSYVKWKSDHLQDMFSYTSRCWPDTAVKKRAKLLIQTT